MAVVMLGRHVVVRGGWLADGRGVILACGGLTMSGRWYVVVIMLGRHMAGCNDL